MKIIDKPGTADVGEFSPLVTPLETPEVVTTAHTQAVGIFSKLLGTAP